MKPYYRSYRSAVVFIVVIIGLLAPAPLAAYISRSADLTPDEQNNIDIFNNTNKSVVYVTNSQIRRDYFSLNIYEIPAGTGST